MGREVKRVALNFDWPLNLPWKGYVSPYSGQKCICDGSGVNPETKKISDDFYAFEDRSRSWRNSITQDEVQALVDAGRLMDFTHEWTPGKGWQPKEPPVVPTAEEVNAWNSRGMGHDAINRWILVEARAKRIGVYGKCHLCGGEGYLWPSDEIKAAADAWKDIEPPEGEGWQVWETVSEGSPITPVFATREALIDYLVEGGDDSDRKRGDGGWTRENAESFVAAAWAPSLIGTAGALYAPRDGSPFPTSEGQ